MIRFACECGRLLQAAATQAGSSAVCPTCDRVVVVPEEATADQLDRARYVQLAADSQRSDAVGAIESSTTEKQLASDFQGRVSRKAIVSLLVGIVLVVSSLEPMFHGGTADIRGTILIGFLLAVVANFALAISALRDINRNPVQLGGHRLAAMGALSTSLCFLLLLLQPSGCRVGVWSPNMQARNNLIQLGLAFQTFHQDRGHFPASAIRSPAGKPLLSWRVAILPYVEEEELYKEFHLDEPWNSPHNLTLLPRMPWTYVDREFDRSDGLTRFQVYIGPGTAFGVLDGPTLDDFRDGAAKTVLISEGEQRVPWTKPIDLPFGPEVVLVRPHVRDLYEGKGSWVLGADGDVHRVPVDCPEEVLRALITRNGGEDVDWPK